ncbi:MAG: hypothetical protein Q7J73_09010 [Dehalococcoidales bacterium]|nr:hypothetical protein [Dehalococcoidales bacterium]
MACWWELGRRLAKADAWMNLIMGSGAGFKQLDLIYNEDSRFIQWKNGTRINEMKVGNIRESVPLQAADILAYELWKEWQRLSSLSKRDIRYPLKVIGKVQHEWHYVSDEHLKEFDNDVLRQLANWDKQGDSVNFTRNRNQGSKF